MSDNFSFLNPELKEIKAYKESALAVNDEEITFLDKNGLTIQVCID